MTIQIKPESGLEPPTVVFRGRSGNEYLADLKKLKIGESFFIPGVQIRDLAYLKRLAKGAGLRLTSKWTVKDPRHGVPGVRTWRIARQATRVASDPKNSAADDL